MPPTFSIITPCLDGAATLAESLASVRAQGREDVEHIVVDGGSTDGTVDVLRDSEGVRWISEPDRGLSHAMNKGIAMADGQIVGWLNADDVYLPGALDRVAAAMEAHPKTAWATGPCLIVDSAGEEIRKPITAYKNFFLRHMSPGLLLTQNFVSAPSTFVRRSAFQTVGEFDERFKFSMDYDMWLRLTERLGGPTVIAEPLACFRMTEGTLSMDGFERQFEEHTTNAREHGEGHRAAVAVNTVASRAVVLAYRAMRAARLPGGRETR